MMAARFASAASYMDNARIPSVPAVIRSRRQLASEGVSLLPAGTLPPTSLPIVASGTTYNMAQEAAWLDASHFAVGRWDGSLSIFAFTDSPTTGPVITKSINTPAFEGVQMIVWLAPGVFASSNDDGSLCVWSSPSRKWTDLQGTSLRYDPAWGAANSGDTLVLGRELFFVAGHANGFVTIWKGNPDGTRLRLLRAVDLRNPKPTNPWGLHNIRGVAAIVGAGENGCVVTGSEDGYLCILRVLDGAVLSQTVYNPAAQRGINSVSAMGRHLLVANCSVGQSDKNLWYYEIGASDWTVCFRDSANLQANPGAPQVFNFCARWGWFENAPCFFSSTEEGMLWMGTLAARQHLSVIGYELVYGQLGSALAFSASGKLVVANYNLYEFTTGSMPPSSPSEHPGRLTVRSKETDSGMDTF
jgi:hypothetical protein